MTIYQPSNDLRKMFAMPRWVVKSGVVIVDDTEIRNLAAGVTHRSNVPELEPESLEPIRRWWKLNATSDWSSADIGSTMRDRLKPVNLRGQGRLK